MSSLFDSPKSQFEKLALSKTRFGDASVVATEQISPGEFVLQFYGEQLRGAEIEDFSHALQIGPDLYLDASGLLDDFVNHCCDPNCVVAKEGSRIVLRARREILSGEEITFDYATTMLDDPTTFECRCGADNCRGVLVTLPKLRFKERAALEAEGLIPQFMLDFIESES